MDEAIRQLVLVLRGMWQWRWTGVVVAWVCGFVGAVAILRMPDQYEASARVYVDTQSVLKPLMSGLAVQLNVDQQIAMLSRTLISRPNVEKLIRMADLDREVKAKEELERLADRLTKTLEIKSAGRDNLYTLAYRDPDPAKAKRVVQSLASIFVESSLGEKRQDADAAKQFIEGQIKIYEKKLEEAENRLKEFKLRNLFIESGGSGDSFARIGELNTALNQAKLELREAENSRDALKRLIAGEAPVLLTDSADAVSSPPVPEIDGRIEAMKRSLDTLLQRFTDLHPDVVGTRRVIRELEEQRLQQLASRKASNGSQSMTVANGNPVYQQLRVSLAEAEANVASLQTRVAEYESRYNRLKGGMQMMPQIEAEFAQLNRDYDVHKKSYESLVARRESASISGDMESASGVADFRLIDPPRVSPRPVAPNRLMLLLLGMLAAFGVGALSSFVASQIRPTLSDVRSLQELTSMPVIGAVPLIVSEPARRGERRGLVGFAIAVLALIGSYGAGLVLILLLSVRTV